MAASSTYHRVFIGLGANLGDRVHALQDALNMLRSTNSIAVVRASGWYASPAVVKPGRPLQPDYLNGVAELDTRLSPLTLLDVLERIERDAGRRLEEKSSWSARPLDLDILAYGSEIWHDDRLLIPHRALAERRFVLSPWAEIAPEFEVPHPFNATVKALLCACPDQNPIERLLNRG